MPIGKRFYFNFYIGLGLRTKELIDINKEFNPTIHELRNDDDIISLDPFELYYDERTALNMSLGFKFGFKL